MVSGDGGRLSFAFRRAQVEEAPGSTTVRETRGLLAPLDMTKHHNRGGVLASFREAVRRVHEAAPEVPLPAGFKVSPETLYQLKALGPEERVLEAGLFEGFEWVVDLHLAPGVAMPLSGDELLELKREAQAQLERDRYFAERMTRGGQALAEAAEAARPAFVRFEEATRRLSGQLQRPEDEECER